MPRLLGIGDNTVDIYLDEAMQYPGGNAVNVAVQARRRGAAASYLGCLGTDARGRLVLDSLRAEQVDVSHCRVIDVPNAYSRILHRDGDRHFAGSDPGPRARYGLTAADDAFIAAHDLAHTGTHADLDAELPRLRRQARLLSYDHSVHYGRPGKAATMRHLDVAFLSVAGDEATCREVLGWCRGQGAALAVATRGGQGAMALSAEGLHSVPAAPALLRDTLGAGDAFIAAFLLRWLAERDIAAALAAGVVAGAEACAGKGGYGHGMPVEPGDPAAYRPPPG
jgi:fructoselysine 6-kinase